MLVLIKFVELSHLLLLWRREKKNSRAHKIFCKRKRRILEKTVEKASFQVAWNSFAGTKGILIFQKITSNTLTDLELFEFAKKNSIELKPRNVPMHNVLFRLDVIFRREPLKNVNLIVISFLLFSDRLTGFNLVWATPKNFRKNCWKSKFSSCLKSHLRIPKEFWFFGIWNWESYRNHWNVEDACPFFCRRHDNPLLCLKPPVSA